MLVRGSGSCPDVDLVKNAQPCKSALSIESPGWRETVEEVVEINADIPWQAASI
jgi:hypothetical protein